MLNRTPQTFDLETSLVFPTSQDITDAATTCHTELGVWPISFSYPKATLPVHADRVELISSIRPGTAYAFDSEQAYMHAYANASYSITHRKAGWDCFRHVEIMASGSLPLMVDAHEIPQHCLVHYPKQAMRGILDHFLISRDRAPSWIEDAFREHFESHLTSTAMAQYLLKASGLENAGNVLFVDAQLPLSPDYQSVLTLIGLKQLLGARCRAFYPTPYVYEDFKDALSLYGRGFGYTCAVSRSARPSSERQQSSRALGALLRSGGFDAVIIGSIARNAPLAMRILEMFPPEQTVWIHGEDAPPSDVTMELLRTSGTHAFVRAVPDSSAPA